MDGQTKAGLWLLTVVTILAFCCGALAGATLW